MAYEHHDVAFVTADLSKALGSLLRGVELIDDNDSLFGRRVLVLNLSKVEFVDVVFDSACQSEVKTQSNSLIAHDGTLK